MAADDESRARAVLADMQLRISQGPHCALGVSETTMYPDEVRAAFLALTKQFHPARFGRMSSELQKLSNEVFLGIKLAHETVMKSLGASTRPRSNAQFGSAGIPHVAEGTARTSGQVPRTKSAGTAPPQTQLARGTDRSTPSPVSTSQSIRSGTPALGIAIARPASAHSQTGPVARPQTGALQANQSGSLPRPPEGPVHVDAPTSQPRQTGSMPPLQRPGTAPPAAPPTPGGTAPLSRSSGPPVAASTPRHPTPGGTAPLSRPPAPRPGVDNFNPPTQRGVDSFNPPTQRGVDSFNPPTQRGLQPSGPAPSSTNFNVATVPGVAPTQPTQLLTRVAPATAAAFDERATLREALQLIDQKNWTGARHVLHDLAANVPQSKTYRALLCYARGREAHVAGRAEDALLEYQRALQLDPELMHVKQAVAELQRQR